MLAATNNQIYLSASLFLLFLAVQNSSIGDLVTHSLTEPLFILEHIERPFHTFQLLLW